MYIGNAEVTKREILFSIIIICVVLTVGFFAHSAIKGSIIEQNQYYYKSLKIDNDSEVFGYSVDTSVGNIMAFGQLITTEPIGLSELKSTFLAIEKHEERYTRHTRIRKVGKVTTTETYYTWDSHGGEYYKASTFSILGREFPTSIVELNANQRLDINKDNISEKYQKNISRGYLYEDKDFFANVGDLRWYYKVLENSTAGTLYGNLVLGSLNVPENVSLCEYYEGQTIESVIQDRDDLEGRASVIFWSIWIVVMFVGIGIFVYAENNWLE